MAARKEPGTVAVVQVSCRAKAFACQAMHNTYPPPLRHVHLSTVQELERDKIVLYSSQHMGSGFKDHFTTAKSQKGGIVQAARPYTCATAAICYPAPFLPPTTIQQIQAIGILLNHSSRWGEKLPHTLSPVTFWRILTS